jgi:hypothetical protein
MSSAATYPEYPAHFDAACPGRLSRWLVLVKWWLNMGKREPGDLQAGGA